MDISQVVPGIIDTHIHQWDPFTTPREASRLAPLYRRAPGLFERLMPLLLDRGSRELILTAQHVARAYLPADYAADVDPVRTVLGVPVTDAVHVQCGWHRPDQSEETAWLDTLPFGVEGRPRLAAIVGNADPRDPDFARHLDDHAAASDRFRGIRFMTAHHPDSGVKSWIEEPDVLTSAPVLRGLAALVERGLTLDTFVFSHQLREVAALAAEYPELTIVLDHYATPIGLLGARGKTTGRTEAERADLLARWREDIAVVAEHQNVVAKHSGLAFPPLGHSARDLDRSRLAELVAPLVEHTTTVFGADRLVFGSNYPMDKPVARIEMILGALVDLLAPHGPDLVRKVLHDNAKRVYTI